MHELYKIGQIEKIKDKLLARHETLAVAESVTSGYLQAGFSLAENATMFYQGGMTTYNLGQKCRHLQIEPTHAQACNSVSDKVAGDMAKSIASLFLSDWGIGITGYAQKVPELSINSLFAFYAISHKYAVVDCGRIAAPDLKMMEVQLFYTNEVITRLCNILSKM